MYSQTKANLKSCSLGHFFDDATMKFFNSYLETQAYSLDNETYYFITSEKFNDDSERLFTIRTCRYEDNFFTELTTCRDFPFQHFASLKDAKKAMNETYLSRGV